jgi:hypothetical protein
MLKNWIRIFTSDNGVLTDKSLENGSGIPAALVATEDYIYIGQYFPFNNIFIEIETANNQESVLSLEYWTGSSNEWVTALDILDGTSSGGATLAKNGLIQWEVDIDESYWMPVYDPRDFGSPDEFSNIVVYDLYWSRIKVSADLKAETSIKKIGYAYTDSETLASIDPQINSYLNSWSTGKTSWLDQVYIGTQHVIVDLKQAKMVRSPAGILRYDDLWLAATYRTLAIIYSGLGPRYQEKVDAIMKQYDATIKGLPITVDETGDARAQVAEYSTKMGTRLR